MKKLVAVSVFLLVLVAFLAQADVGYNVNINVGNQPPVYANPPVAIGAPPEFLLPPQLGFYVAVGVPYDMFFTANIYYLYRNNIWYRAPHYRGPWVVVPYRSLPPGIRKHRLERIHYYRDVEYRHYHADERRYKGRHFRPEKEWKEQRKEERRDMKQEKKFEKEQRKQEKKFEKEQRKEDRKFEKEQQKQEKHGGHGER